MGSSTANISRRMYDERKRYVQTVLQMGVPLVDADYNEAQESFYTQLRRAVQAALGDGAPGDAFKVVELRRGGALVPNDFGLKGGYDARTGPERLFVAGHAAALSEDVDWLTSPEVAPVSTGLTECELYDSAAFFEPDSLVGRTLIPDVGGPEQYEIVGNTQNSIRVRDTNHMVADGARPGAHYRIALSTPAANRVDLVYIDAYLDEIDGREDPSILHTFSTKIEAMRRLRLVQAVLVAEGRRPPGPPRPDAPLVDADGNEHFILPIAEIRREAGNPLIEARMIRDLRRKLFSLDQVEDRFVDAAGDTMRGDLVFAPGARISGREVIGEAELRDGSVTQPKLDRRTHLLGDGDVVPPARALPLVHDNRYWRKSLLRTFFGRSVLVNGGFVFGLLGWFHAAPHAIVCSPGLEEIDKVTVFWLRCGFHGCCHAVSTIVRPGFKGCEVCVIAQEFVVCHGGLFVWELGLRVIRGSARVRPFLAVACFASGRFLGVKRVSFKRTIGASAGYVRLSVLFDLDHCVDRALVSLCFEIVFDGCALHDLLEFAVCDVRARRFGDVHDAHLHDGAFGPGEPPPMPGLPGTPPDHPGHPPDEPEAPPFDPLVPVVPDGETWQPWLPAPVIERVTPSGSVMLAPGALPDAVIVYRSAGATDAPHAWSPAEGAAVNPEVVDVIHLRYAEVFVGTVGSPEIGPREPIASPDAPPAPAPIPSPSPAPPPAVGRPRLAREGWKSPGALAVVDDGAADRVTILEGSLLRDGRPVKLRSPEGPRGALEFGVASTAGFAGIRIGVGLADLAGNQLFVADIFHPEPVEDGLRITLPEAEIHLPRLDPLEPTRRSAFKAISLPLSAFQQTAGPVDLSEIAALRIVLTPAPDRGEAVVTFDDFVFAFGHDLDGDGEPDRLVLEDFTRYATDADLAAVWRDIGARHAIAVGAPLFRGLDPIVICPADRDHVKRFFGEPGWQEADVVLVPGTLENRAKGLLDQQHRIAFGFVTYRRAPWAGFRNVFVEPVYLAWSCCRAVVVGVHPYRFDRHACECIPADDRVQFVGEFVTDRLLHRLIPDDGFDGLTTDYGQTFFLEYCDPRKETWVELPPSQVLHAGGGRADPQVPPSLPRNPRTGEPVFVTVYHGPGSPRSRRETRIAVDVTVPAGARRVRVILAPDGADGFAAGMPVWLRNECDYRMAKYRLHCCDIEEARFAGPFADLTVSGLYGRVVAVEPAANAVLIELDAPTARIAEFRTAWKAELLVSPKDAMGFYWEPSPGLVNLVHPPLAAHDDEFPLQAGGVVLRWWFRYWEASASRCTEHGFHQQLGVLLCDGDGYTRGFRLLGDTAEVLNPFEFRTLFCAPIIPHRLLIDFAPGGNTIEVCAPWKFRVGDVITVADEVYSAGWTTSVVKIDETEGRLVTRTPLPKTLLGYPAFDGFKIARRAVVFREVTRAHSMKSPTDRANPDGTPFDGPDFVAIDRDQGLFTFDPAVDAAVEIRYTAERRTLPLRPEPGLYTLRAMNGSGLTSAPSAPIRVKGGPS